MGGREKRPREPSEGCSPVSPVSPWHVTRTWGPGSRLLSLCHGPSPSRCSVLLPCPASSLRKCARAYSPVMAEVVCARPHVLQRSPPPLRPAGGWLPPAWVFAGSWATYSQRKTPEVTWHGFHGDAAWTLTFSAPSHHIPSAVLLNPWYREEARLPGVCRVVPWSVALISSPPSPDSG